MPRKRKPTLAEYEAIDRLGHAMRPEEWKEFEEGKGVCSNQAAWIIMDSIRDAKRLIRAFPGIVELVNNSPVLATIGDKIPLTMDRKF